MRPRATTIVWGGIITLIGVFVLIVNLGGLLRWPNLDPVAVVVGVIGGLGALLVLGAIIGAIVSATRERRGTVAAPTDQGAPAPRTTAHDTAARDSSPFSAPTDAAERDAAHDTADTLRLG